MRKDLAGKISDSELEVMKLLWHAEAFLSITEIREKLQQTKGWEPATIKTLVSRLVSKGAVRQEKRKVYYYSPLISEKEYGSWATCITAAPGIWSRRLSIPTGSPKRTLRNFATCSGWRIRP